MQDPPSTEKIEQSLYWPEPLLAFVQAEAHRIDRTFSWVVQRAWKLTRDRIAALASAEQAKEHVGSLVEVAKRKQNLFFPAEILGEMKREAARLDRSTSWVVHLAVSLSRPELAKIPSAEEVDEA
jgi:uncharacterized small protein (TIGR04563 family)